jgi:hypothetical protein
VRHFGGNNEDHGGKYRGDMSLENVRRRGKMSHVSHGEQTPTINTTKDCK